MDRIYRIFPLVVVVLLFAASAFAQMPGELMAGTKLVGVWEGLGGYRRPFSLEIVSIQGDKVKANYCQQLPTALGAIPPSQVKMEAGCIERTGVIKGSSIIFQNLSSTRGSGKSEMVIDMEKNTASAHVWTNSFSSPITTVKASAKERATGVAKEQATVVPDDASITAEVKLELSRAPRLKDAIIEVSTTEGVVTLKGRVKYTVSKRDATKLAKEVKGVKSVDNQLEIVR
ncbi:MAG: BON domain-containing protein [Syntrophales bacterium]|jgi:hyperosmotically inducible periplasmic protein